MYGIAGHIIGIEDERIPKNVLNGKFHFQDQWENQEQDGRNTRMAEMSRRQRRMEASREGEHCPQRSLEP
jgi:hypothetical protein